MKDSFFAESLIIAGAILIASTNISGGSIGMLFGIPLLMWGVAERIFILFKSKKQQ